MGAIGGYFELELRQGEHYHADAIRLNTARNCFEYILQARRYRKVYIPYYTCEVMLEPLRKHKIAFEFYSINEELEPAGTKHLLSDEAFLYTNYYGLKQWCVEKLALIYGSRLIVDNAQAFYAPRLTSIDTFYSPRKFFGVPDGGYLYTDCVLEQEFPQDKSYRRMRHLLQRIDEGAENGYSFFRENDTSLDDNPIRKMSELTQRILTNIDYENVKERRRENFLFVHDKLKKLNCLSFDLTRDDVPMVYPYLCKDNILREKLVAGKIYVATYWRDMMDYLSEGSLEERLMDFLIPLPIDQRYSIACMEKTISIVIN